MHSDHYYYALDNPEYKPVTSEDHFREIKTLAAKYNIPVRRITYDTHLDDFVFV